MNADGITTLSSERIEAARELDHLGHPVAAAEDRVDPLQKEHASTGRAAQLVRQPHDALVLRRDERFCNYRSPREFGELAQVVLNLPEAPRRERQHLHVSTQRLDGALSLVSRRSAHLAEVLCEDDIGLERSQEL